MRKTKGCIFCGHQPTIEAHLLSGALRELLGYGDSGASSRAQAFLDLNSPVPTDLRSVRMRKTNFAKLRAKVVCRACYEGWMGEGEGLLESLLRGTTLRLDPEEQATVAAWALMTTMLFEYASAGQEIVISPYWKRGLFRTRIPPTPCCDVWIGPSGEETPELAVCKSYRWGYLTKPGGELQPWFGVSNVFSLARVQILVLACNLTPPGGQRWDELPDAEGFVTPAGLRRIWPTTDPFDFPTDPGLDALDPFVLGHSVIGYLQRLGITGGNPSPQGFIGEPPPRFPELPPEP